MSYRDAPNPGPLWGYPGLIEDPEAWRSELYTPRTVPTWTSQISPYESAQSPFPSDLPRPMVVVPEVLAGARISSPYGPRAHPTEGHTHMHHGVDLAVPVGTPVYAVSPVATVVAVARDREPLRGGPMIAVVETPDGYRWEYMHLSALFVEPGQVIDWDTPIGLSGSAGTGPHLHFVARAPDGERVDPVSLFPPGTFSR